jgi:hypothetical protein
VVPGRGSGRAEEQASASCAALSLVLLGADICVQQVVDGEIFVPELAVESVERKVDMSLDVDRLMKRLTAVVEETYSGRDFMIAMEQIRLRACPKRS